MILTDIFRPEPDLQWELAAQLGVRNAVIRLPENPEFDYTDPVMMKEFFDRFKDRGFRPLVIEPMPNRLHDHIKRGDGLRDECIETVKKMIPILKENGIETICTNFVVEVGWYRTSATLPERGGALVTEFNIDDVNIDPSLQVKKEEVWERLEYFLKAVMPVCEEYDVNIALHPDDPPIEKLGNLERILISKDNIQKALDIYPSRNLGVTMCQA
ncbi:MAG: mannonate dehydratase, partial [Erysipelotrichaceae bacterium]|nr:mannonate dehydratase [Erysipelotrichaceae bacterium]